jgi:hypothetical protein
MTDRGLAAASAQREGAQAPSEKAEGTERDPANNAPALVYLASDEGAYISGHIFSTAGYRIALWSKWGEEKAIYSPGPWDYDHLFSIFKGTLGSNITQLEAAQPGGGGGGA